MIFILERTRKDNKNISSRIEANESRENTEMAPVKIGKAQPAEEEEEERDPQLKMRKSPQKMSFPQQLDLIVLISSSAHASTI